MAKMPDIVAPCGCRLIDNDTGALDLIECEPYRDRPDALCPTAANILKAAQRAGLDTAVAYDLEDDDAQG